MAKDRYWFEHDSNAHSDPLIIQLRMKYGLGGYGAFWVLVESLRDSDDYKIDMSLVDALCFEYRIKKEWFEFMIEIELFKTDGAFFWSESLFRRMIAWDKKREKCRLSGALGGLAKANALANAKANALANALAITEQNRTEQNNNKNTRTQARATVFQIDREFDEFWKAYPKKTGKKAARKAFERAKKDGMPSTVAAIVETQRTWSTWIAENGRYIPNPATWLNQGRWDDEQPNGGGSGPTSQQAHHESLRAWVEEGE